MTSKLNLIVIAIGRVIQTLVLFYTYRAITHTLPINEVGHYFFFLAVAGFTGLVLVNPVGQYFNRFLHLWMQKQTILGPVLKFIFFAIAASIITAVVALLLGWGKSFVSGFLPLAVSIYALGTALTGFLTNALNLAGRPILFTLMTLGYQISSLALAWLAATQEPTALTWLAVSGAVNVLWGLAASLVLISSKLTKDVNDHIAANADAALHTTLFRFSAPLAVSNLGVWFLTQGYRPIAEWQFGAERLALIGLGLGLASSIASAFEMLTHQIFLPRFYADSHHASDHARSQSWARLIKILLPMHIMVALGTMGFSVILLQVMAPESYQGAFIYIVIGAGAELLRIVGNLANLQAISGLQMHKSVAPYFLGATTSLAVMVSTGWIAISNLIGHLISSIFLIVRFPSAGWRSALDRKFWGLSVLSLLFLTPLIVQPDGGITLQSLALATVAVLIFSIVLAAGAIQWSATREEKK